MPSPSGRQQRRQPTEAVAVEFRGVTKRYAGQTEPAVQDLSLEVPAGEICVLVGPSGCGKTTAMRMVNRTVEITEGDILIGGTSVRDREPAQLRREIGYVIQQIGLFPHRTIAENIATVPGLLGWDRERIDAPGRRAARADRARPRDARPLPRPALGRPAAAGRRRPGARRGPAGDADGRALRRDRPDQPRAPPERVPPPPGRDPQDGPVRHPRHRRGDQDGRPDRGPEAGRQARPVRDPGRAADGPGRRLRRGLRRRRPGPEAAGADAGPRRRPLGGAARLRRPGDRARCGRSSRAPRCPTPCWSTPSAGRSAGSRSATSPQETVPGDARHRRPTRSSTATTSCATRSRTCSRPRPMYAPGRRRRRTDRRRALGRDHLGLPQLARRRRSRSTRRPSGRWPMPDAPARSLAQVEIRDRSGGRRAASPRTAPSASTGRSTTSTATSTPLSSTWSSSSSRSCSASLIAFAPGAALAPPALAGRRPSSASPGSSTRSPRSPSSSCCSRSPGRGRDTAIIALTAYTLQIIYRNIVAGLNNVPEGAKDAGRGMGMTPAPAPVAGGAAARRSPRSSPGCGSRRSRRSRSRPSPSSPAAAGSAPRSSPRSTSRRTS